MNESQQYFIKVSDPEAATLITEIEQAGIKYSRDRILRIGKDANNKIVFLETGNGRSGLQHIVENHKDEFRDRGITEEQIPDLVMSAIILGSIVGYQSENRPIYEVIFNGKPQWVAVTVSNNGYVVCANPRSLKSL